jgi:hypothetical protein
MLRNWGENDYGVADPMSIATKLISLAVCCSAILLAGRSCVGQIIDASELINIEGEFPDFSEHYRFFPGNIYELRPMHVRLSDPTESAASPRSKLHFPFFEAPPPTPSQGEIRLTDRDELTLVYPSHPGSFHSGGSKKYDRLIVNDSEIVLDLITVPLGGYGSTVVPQRENGLFMGRLAPGVYEVTTRDWALPPEFFPGFDPETFEPSPDTEPLSVNVSVFQFTVIAVPEPSSLTLMLAVLVVLIRWSRRGVRRDAPHLL